MPKNSKARLEANNRYVVRTYETISTRARRTDHINDLVDIAAKRAGQSKAAYILDSITDRLRREGITADDLPSPDDDMERSGKP